VGAGSVVIGELPDHCVAVGVPARVVKQYVEGDGWVAAAGFPDGALRHNSNIRNRDTSDIDGASAESSSAGTPVTGAPSATSL
jgi:hypothetical protein